MPELIQPSPAAATQSKTNHAVDAEKLDKAMLKEMKDGYKAHTTASVQESLLAFDFLKNTFYKRDKGEDDVWKNYLWNEMQMRAATASKKIKVAEFKPFRVKKYQVMVPNGWTVDYELTKLKYEAPNGDLSYDPFYQAFTAGVVNPELSQKEAHSLAVACEAATKDGEFDAQAFAAGIDKVREAQRFASLTPAAQKLETAKAKKKQVDEELSKPARVLSSFSRDEKMSVITDNLEQNKSVPLIAKERGTSPEVVNDILADESLRATAPLNGLAPAPAAALDTEEPTATSIEDTLQADFADENEVIWGERLRQAYAAVRLENLKKKILALLHKEGFRGGTLTYTQR